MDRGAGGGLGGPRPPNILVNFIHLLYWRPPQFVIHSLLSAPQSKIRSAVFDYFASNLNTDKRMVKSLILKLISSNDESLCIYLKVHIKMPQTSAYQFVYILGRNPVKRFRFIDESH